METQERVMDVVRPIQTDVDHHRSLFSNDPEQAYKEAQRLVSVVANRCTGPGYLVNINGKQYPKIEWWTSVSASLGLFPRVLYSKRLDRDGEIAYEAKVEVHRNNQIIASGEAMCSNREDRWRSADEYAIKSMAITRASGKAYRIPLSFLAVMAGLEVTPAEEMPVEQKREPVPEPIRTENQTEKMASEKQLSAIRTLIDHPNVYNPEKRTLHELLEDGNISRQKASEIMSYYYGIQEYQRGSGWVKVSMGKLEERRNH